MNVIRSRSWYISPFGCYAVFDTAEQAEAVRADQPHDLEGLTEDYFTVTPEDTGYRVRVYYPNLKHYISAQDWERVS